MTGFAARKQGRLDGSRRASQVRLPGIDPFIAECTHTHEVDELPKLQA
jgi:hypothetical protein